jgi:hypothetical protein
MRCIPSLHVPHSSSLPSTLAMSRPQMNALWHCNRDGSLHPAQVYTVFDWDHWRAIGAYAGMLALRKSLRPMLHDMLLLLLAALWQLRS